MKMHSQRFRDPLISQAEPITIIGPVIEETMRLARIRPDRERILERFMAGQPRIAIVHGSEDHPPSIGCRDLVRRLVRQLWADGALPVEVSQAIPCEELSRGLPGAHYAFLGRNVFATNLAALMEAHGYDAALVLGACDKMLVGSLRALVEADLARQQRRARPIYAAFLPATVGPEVALNEEERRQFELLRDRLSDDEAAELYALVEAPINARAYERVKAFLDRAFHKRTILEAEKDQLERMLARRAASPGANCASSEASIVNRLMVASFGLVPRNLDLSMKAPGDRQLAHIVRRLVQGIHKRERRISVAQLVKSNLQNGVTVWSATGGHPSWMLHLSYLAEALGVRLSPTMLARKMTKVPCLLGFDNGTRRSVGGIAAESDSGGNSGIDTLMRTLSEKRFIDDRAATLEGSWMQRIMDARSANGAYFHSTMTPVSPNCGLARVHGNLCTGALARLGCQSGGVDTYDRKVYLADFYLGQEDLLEALSTPESVLERVRRKVTRDDLYRIWNINWGASDESAGEMAQWNKRRLWDHMFEGELLRIMLFVAGEGPRASGMPEIRLVDGEHDAWLRRMCVLATDGRIGQSDGLMSVAHIVPEAIQGGPVASIRTGDWVYINLRKGEFQVVTAARKAAGYRVLRDRELSRRADLRKRINELERRRGRMMPSLRSALERVSTASEGMSPLV